VNKIVDAIDNELKLIPIQDLYAWNDVFFDFSQDNFPPDARFASLDMAQDSKNTGQHSLSFLDSNHSLCMNFS
jgi:hypothetical protein